ncbi:YegP family protein [Undibacterium terreum]|uniref:DUF1508 domain-containing protein n=1 Tax=Undibacterium terreum TaxID=1224302 RepID=A0A916V083_9BURK|nr:YegP family protein [Undibacterium terreum]GGC98016.1 hypothetical protein GCM10011396_51920 [Undibacterium terreum]
MAGYYVIKKGSSGMFHFVLKADNHEVILTSETYVSKQGAHTGIASCQVNSPYDSQYDKRNSTSSQPYFVLKAKNGEIIGTSQMYSSTSARDNGIASCKFNGPTTKIVDES